ncbi:MAG TPA: sodium:solute symporter [Thermoanaerobaculia bacterium]|nr:sodium:solute symporter [Thermoanaerobaculia bacterium]HQR66629.1 sodium:solute symporter [Thermoanaerobaculia bacterium]
MESLRLGLPTLLVVLVYLAGINVLGAWLGRGQKDAKDYFLGSRALPWYAVMASVVATETSALTFLSVPGDAYRSGYTFLQLTLGYLAGRVAVSLLLLPSYFRGEIPTAYALLERRFGVGARRFTSFVFMVTRVMAASVRLAVPAIPIALMTGVPVWVAIVALAAATALYTYLGGLKAVVWIDLIQVVVYLTGAVLSLAVLLSRIPGGLAGAFARSAAAGQPVRLFEFALDPSQPYTFWAGVVGGGFLAMASHGADQLIVQRLLACRGLRDAQKALVGSGVLVILQFALFLTLGVCLFGFYGTPVGPGSAFATSDQIFPTFIVTELPGWLSAYLVAGIFSAAMCSESSALNSLASALSLDFVSPLMGRKAVEGTRGLVLGKALTLFWTIVLGGLAIGFSLMPQGLPAVQVALSLASVTGGGLLGAFLLALYVKRAREADAIAAVGLSAVLMFLLWLGARGYVPFPLGKRIAWPWYSMIGAFLTLGAGWLLSRSHGADDPNAAA